MRHDKIDDYVDPITEPAEVVVDKKISLLYDLCILRTRKKDKCIEKDARESALREVLSHYCSETEINNAIHDVIFGNKSINQFLAQKGVQI